VHDLEPEDLRALTIEAAIMSGCPLVGTDIDLHALLGKLSTLADSLASRDAQ
jgi:hypothetical protein